MTNWRVIQQVDEDGCPTFTIGDVIGSRRGILVKHVPPYPVETTLERLHARLNEMADAVNKPVMILHPAKLTDAKLIEQS